MPPFLCAHAFRQCQLRLRTLRLVSAARLATWRRSFPHPATFQKKSSACREPIALLFASSARARALGRPAPGLSYTRAYANSPIEKSEARTRHVVPAFLRHIV